MRILFLTNLYPPITIGGYEQWCQEVAERLQSRGHVVRVLTSKYGSETVQHVEPDVCRLLHLDGDLVHYRASHFFKKWRKEQKENLDSLRQVVQGFAPDVCFVWGMWALSKALPALAERLLPSRVVYYLSDYWPADIDMHSAYWNLPACRCYMRLPKHILGVVARSLLPDRRTLELEFRHVLCVSAAVRDILVESGIPIHQAQVIHGGTDVDRFSDMVERPPCNSGRLELLYAGQIARHKGVHTAIEAVANLVNERGIDGLHLTIVGSGHPEYEASLRALVEREGLQGFVTFDGAVSKTEMPAVFSRADTLIFPSIYEEPFARMTQEAMLAELTLIGTTTGGTKEILRDGENGLTFSAGDAEGLARQINRIITDRELGRALAKAGRRTVLENFTLGGMVDGIEEYLRKIVASWQS